MRKIVAGLFMSLDGVVESPEEWAYQYGNDQMWEEIAAGVARADGVLLGRRTYQAFAQLWPNQPSDVPMAACLNNNRMYVVPTTLGTLWRGPGEPGHWRRRRRAHRAQAAARTGHPDPGQPHAGAVTGARRAAR